MKLDYRVIRPRIILLLAAAVIVGIWGTQTVVWAQSAAATGQIVGQVLDPSAASVGAAEVTVRNTNTNFTRTATTDTEGRYAISELPLGPYDVTVKATGFAENTQQVYVSLGSSVSSNIHLTIAPTNQTAEVVVSDAPGIEPNQFWTNGVYEFPLGFEAGFAMRFTSGRPFNAVTGVDENGDGQNTDRPIINGQLIRRNAYRNYGFKDIDMRVQKNFALPNEKGTIALSAEFFNLTNFANVQLAGAQLTYGLGEQYVNGTLANVGPLPAFGQLRNSQGQYIQTNTAGDPFQAQLGLLYSF